MHASPKFATDRMAFVSNNKIRPRHAMTTMHALLIHAIPLPETANSSPSTAEPTTPTHALSIHAMPILDACTPHTWMSTVRTTTSALPSLVPLTELRVAAFEPTWSAQVIST